jgi:hypothetical protein
MMVRPLSSEERLQRAHDLFIEVDPQDAWLITAMTWRVDASGYVVCNFVMSPGRYTVLKLHHFIIGFPIWEGDEVDHIDRDRRNNRRSNLRWVDRSTNIRNSDRIDAATNITKRSYGYEVRVAINNVTHQVGVFRTEDEAIHARDDFKQRQGIISTGDAIR